MWLDLKLDLTCCRLLLKQSKYRCPQERQTVTKKADHAALGLVGLAQANEWRCRSFEASADGYGRGEGFAVFILGSATSHAAELSSQPIYVASSAVNQDGRSSGLTAPNGPSQTRLVRAALNAAGLQPQDLAYIAVHGTGKLCQSLPLLPCMKVASHMRMSQQSRQALSRCF